MTRQRNFRGQKERRSVEQRESAEVWRVVRELSASGKLRDWTKTGSDLNRAIGRLETSSGNQFAARLALLAHSTGSKKFIDALNELIDLRLDGPDWEDRLGRMLRQRNIEDEIGLLAGRFTIPMLDAIIAFASGETQRGVARLLATSFPESNSYDAAVQYARTWLRTEDSNLHCLLRLWNEIPIGERRQGLRYARARLLISDEQTPSFSQGLVLIRDVLKAYHRLDNKGLAKLVDQAGGNANDREGSILDLFEQYP